MVFWVGDVEPPVFSDVTDRWPCTPSFTCLQGVQRRVAFFFQCFLELAFLSWALGDLLLKEKELLG